MSSRECSTAMSSGKNWLGPRMLPRDWPGFDISYRFGGTRYEILCRASEEPAKGSFTLDGIKVSDSSLQLIDDGKHHRVHVHVQRRAISAGV